MTKFNHGLEVQGFLREIVEVPRLQEVLDKFAKATCLAAIVTDVDGVPITQPSNFTRFCKVVRSSKEGLKGCYKSDGQGGKLACERRNLSLYECHCGLIDMAAPLIIEGVYWGAVLCGQVQFKKPSEERRMHVRGLARRFGLDEDEMDLASERIQIVSESNIRASGELLQIVANYIVEMSISRLAHKKIAQQLEESAKKERVMHQLELRALQSQINPHFLFNTLNATSRLALIEGAEKTEEMINALSRLLRYSLRNIDNMVPLREALDFISDYLFIQKTRYGDHIDFKLVTEQEVLNTMIPLMTLQPVVENAIVHGLEPKEDGGCIIVTARTAGDRICIEVKDTGLGMDKSDIKMFLDGNRTWQGHTTGIGINNVHKRLQYCFGESYGLEISSTPGKGTTVLVWIPAGESKSKEERVNG